MIYINSAVWRFQLFIRAVFSEVIFIAFASAKSQETQ